MTRGSKIFIVTLGYCTLSLVAMMNLLMLDILLWELSRDHNWFDIVFPVGFATIMSAVALVFWICVLLPIQRETTDPPA